MFPPPPPKRPPVHPPPLSAAASISPNTPQPLPPSAAPRTPFRTHPYQYPYAFPSLHRDPADRPHASPAAEARTGNDHTLTNNALYHLLLSGHPPHADVPSPSSSSSSEDADSGYRECRVPYRGEAPVPDTEADAEKDTPTDARVGGILINPLQPQASQVPEEKKKKSVSFAKTVNVRHYPENSYPDVRKFEEERRSRRKKKKKKKLGLGLSAVGEEGNEEEEDGKDSEEVLKRSEEEEKGEEGEGEGKEECCETAAVVLQKEEVEVEEKKENAPKGWKKRSLEG